MLQIRKVALSFLLVIGALCSHFTITKAQYINKLYDFNPDTLNKCYETASNIFIRPDGSYLITGQAYTLPFNKAFLYSMAISADGKVVIKKSSIGYGSVAANYYQGLNGSGSRAGAAYVIPFGVASPWTNSGICKYDITGDTLFTRTYTDTNKYNDAGMQAIMLSDSSFMVVGERDSVRVSANYSCAYVQHISSIGNLVWIKTYKRDTAAQERFVSIEELSDGRILIGGSLVHHVTVSGYGFTFSQPRFSIVDTTGAILKDTVYSAEYVGGGNIHKDANGGYFHWGGKDSTPDPSPRTIDEINWPGYIAHLDSNFNVVWRQSFIHYPFNFCRVWQTIQLRDSGYLVLGQRNSTHINGWAAKLDKRGSLKWERPYWQDSSRNGYLVDAEQRADGSFAMVGWTQACATCSQDVWLISIDSNGCEIPGCSYTLAVPHEPAEQIAVSLYPNPTSGTFSIDAAARGRFALFNMQGSRVAEYTITQGKQLLHLFAALSAGIYIGQYSSDDGKTTQTIRLIYRP